MAAKNSGGPHKPGAKDWKDNKYGLEDGYKGLDAQQDVKDAPAVFGGFVALVVTPILAIIAIVLLVRAVFY